MLSGNIALALAFALDCRLERVVTVSPFGAFVEGRKYDR
jgi:hypothetical protein